MIRPPSARSPPSTTTSPVPSLAAAIRDEYEHAWATLRNGTKVAEALAFEDWEHFWIASSPETGAFRNAERRLRA